MSDIRLSRSHNLMPEEREQVMSSLIEYLSTTLNATVERSEGHVVFKGAGFKGHVKLDAVSVEGEVRLGMMMKPLKGAISREIGKVLDQYLGVH
jgi:putative polyhydroxyalkanoate system protein